MKRLTCIFAIVLGLAALKPASVAGYSNAASVTAAGTGLFETGAALGGVALQGVQLGTGVFIETDGSASGTFHAVLQGRHWASRASSQLKGKLTPARFRRTATPRSAAPRRSTSAMARRHCRPSRFALQQYRTAAWCSRSTRQPCRPPRSRPVRSPSSRHRGDFFTTLEP